jgi:16S rRNA C967 or C1407 C5-methylase (RsmB/RsmF family)
VKEGKLIIQDKASCFPSQVLYDAWHSLPENEGTAGRGDFIDACAAPGNKTSHLAALAATAGGHSKVYAFEKNSRRAQLLKDRMAQMAVQNTVKVNNTDFLGIDVYDARYQHVTAVLLDPSCSGSGVVRSLERAVEGNGEGDEEAGDRIDRLSKLQAFQIKAIQKAMTFPRVQKIVYSTCSIHKEENEYVVAEILRQFGVPEQSNTAKSTKNAKKNANSVASASSTVGMESGWKVTGPDRLAAWKRRGLPIAAGEVHISPEILTTAAANGAKVATLTTAQSAALVRCSPEDGTNGFFVCLFERVGPLPEVVVPVPIPAATAATAAARSNHGNNKAQQSEQVSGKKRKNNQESQQQGGAGAQAQAQAQQQEKQTAYPARKPKGDKPEKNSLFGGKFKVQRKR